MYVFNETFNTTNGELKQLGEKLAMQVVAMNPKYLNVANIPETELRMKREEIEATVENKERIKDLNKVVDGKLNKWFKEVVLVEQEFVIVDHGEEANKLVEDVVKEKGKALGLDLKITQMRLFS